MISYIYGTFQGWDGSSAIIVVDGVGLGLSVRCTSRTLEGISVGSSVEVHVHVHYSQNGPELFGFSSTLEREIFRRLLRARGVGTKSALSLLDELAPSELVQAVLAGDSKMLTRARGIGKKGAARLINDLREVFEEFGGLPAPDLPPSGMEVVQEVESTLKALGYGREEIAGVLDRINELARSGQSTEEIIAVILPEMLPG